MNQSCTTGTPTATAIAYSPILEDRKISVTSYAVELDQPLATGLGAVVGVGHHKQSKDDGADASANSARLGLYGDITQGTRLYGTVARKVGAPSIRQLYDPQTGNDGLRFERANHLEVGSNTSWSRARLNVALYQSRIKDFIERSELTGLSANNERYLIRGMDVSSVLQASDRLTLRANLGLLDAHDLAKDSDVDTLQYRPRNKARLDAEYRFHDRWSIWGAIQHIGAQAYYSRTAPTVKANLDAYDLVFAQLRYRLACDCGSYYLGVDNLLDKDYATSYGFPQAGRFVYTGVDFRW